MYFVRILSLAMGVASMAISPLPRLNLRRPSTLLPDVSPEALSTSNKPIQPFSISNLFSQSFVDSNTAWNRSLSFVFSDPNSNTSTICSKSWTDSNNNTSTAPNSYVLCDDTGNKEAFQWQFLSYTSIQQFSIGFAHGWDDPVEYPPPYSWVNMFSTENTFSLTCATNNAGLQHCIAPQNPYSANINGISN